MESSWIDCVRNEELVKGVEEERNILCTIKRRNADPISRILRRNCLHVIEGKIEGKVSVKGRRGRRRKQLLKNLKENKGNRRLIKEVLGGTMWRTRCEGVYGPLVRQTTY